MTSATQPKGVEALLPPSSTTVVPPPAAPVAKAGVISGPDIVDADAARPPPITPAKRTASSAEFTTGGDKKRICQQLRRFISSFRQGEAALVSYMVGYPLTVNH